MEIDQLTTFVAVATVGGFHRAAETLRVSQPAVSARIKALEDSLGSPLFARSRSGLTLNEEAEIGLARSLQHPMIETISLRDGPLLLVAHPVQGPTRARHARLEQVAAWPLIFYERGSSDWTLTHSLFRRAGLVPNIAFEVDTIETAKRMVERGLGVAFLPQLAVGREIRAGKLLAIKLLDAEPLRRSLDVIHPRQRPLRGQAQAFLRALKEVADADPASIEGGRSQSRRRGK